MYCLISIAPHVADEDPAHVLIARNVLAFAGIGFSGSVVFLIQSAGLLLRALWFGAGRNLKSCPA